jgi:hypothetical protein
MRRPPAWTLLSLWWLYSRIVMGAGGVDGATQWVRDAPRFPSLDQCEAHATVLTLAWQTRLPSSQTSLRLQTRCTREEDAPPSDLEGP